MTRDEALSILEAAADRAGGEDVRTPEVRAALRALLPMSRDRSFLDWFWESAFAENAIGRSQNCRAALNLAEKVLVLMFL